MLLENSSCAQNDVEPHIFSSNGKHVKDIHIDHHLTRKKD